MTDNETVEATTTEGGETASGEGGEATTPEGTTASDGTEKAGTAKKGKKGPKAEKAAKKAKAATPAKAKAKKPAKAAKPTKAAKPAKAPRASPPVDGGTSGRVLPKIGTVIEKRDRSGAVRCKCEVIDGGIRYKGKTYGSLSAAAMAAAGDLGLKAEALNGWVWWGLQAAQSAKDPVEAVQSVSARFIERAKALLTSANDDDRAALVKEVERHAAAVEKLLK